MSCGVSHRRGLDPMLLWLWCSMAAVAMIRPLAWELPYASGVALKNKKQNKQTKTYLTLSSQIFLTIVESVNAD